MHERTQSVTSELHFDVSIFCLYRKYPFILVILLRAFCKLPKPCWDFTSYQLPQASQNHFSLWWKWGWGVTFTFFIKTLMVSKCAVRSDTVSCQGFSQPLAFLGCHQAGGPEWALPELTRALEVVAPGAVLREPWGVWVHSHTQLTHTGSGRANSNTHPACNKYVGSVWNGLCRQQHQLNTTDDWFIELLN